MAKDSSCFLHLQGILGQRGPSEPYLRVHLPPPTPFSLNRPSVPPPQVIMSHVFHFRPNLTLSGT